MQQTQKCKNLVTKARNLQADIRSAFYRYFPANIPLQGEFKDLHKRLNSALLDDNVVNQAWQFANGGYRDVLDIILIDYLEARSVDMMLSDDSRAMSAGLCKRFAIRGLSILDPENMQIRKEIYQFLKTV